MRGIAKLHGWRGRGCCVASSRGRDGCRRMRGRHRQLAARRKAECSVAGAHWTCTVGECWHHLRACRRERRNDTSSCREEDGAGTVERRGNAPPWLFMYTCPSSVRMLGSAVVAATLAAAIKSSARIMTSRDFEVGGGWGMTLWENGSNTTNE